MRNALSIDVEDYYQVAAFDAVVKSKDWPRYERRVERNTHRILDLLDRHATQATFFVLGWVAECHPGMVRTIDARGHEVASHGYAHQRIYTQTPAAFREETRRAKRCLEDLIGKPVLGYRAASYSITRQSLWALPILCDEGFVYDSSISPIRHDLYGIPGYSRFCHILNHPGCRGLVEFPVSTIRLGGLTIPIAGGGYFRLFPYAVTRWGIRRLNRRDRHPAMVYLHPWEVDPEQPRIQAGRLAQFRHYQNLGRTTTRLNRLLQDFRFGTMHDVLRERGLLSDVQPSNAVIKDPIEGSNRR